MEWKNGKLTKAMIHSTLGGNCRIRTNDKMMVQNAVSNVSVGQNPNSLFQFIDAGKPIVKDASKVTNITENQGFTIDFNTKKAEVYEVK